jgi:hypothetical protein
MAQRPRTGAVRECGRPGRSNLRAWRPRRLPSKAASRMLKVDFYEPKDGWGNKKKHVLTPALLRGEGDIVPASLANCAAGMGVRHSHIRQRARWKSSPPGSFARGSGRRFPAEIPRIEPLNLKKHSTFNSQHSTPKAPPVLRGWALNVEC